MSKNCLRPILLLFLLQSLANDVFAQLARNSQEVWPSVDAYYRLNRKWRLYGTIGGTKLNESSYADGAVGVFVDYFASVLPEEALVRYQNKYYGFIKKGANKFNMTEVEIGTTQDGFIEVKVSPEMLSSEFVTKGAYNVLMSLKNKAED